MVHLYHTYINTQHSPPPPTSCKVRPNHWAHRIREGPAPPPFYRSKHNFSKIYLEKVEVFKSWSQQVYQPSPPPPPLHPIRNFMMRKKNVLVGNTFFWNYRYTPPPQRIRIFMILGIRFWGFFFWFCLSRFLGISLAPSPSPTPPPTFQLLPTPVNSMTIF